MNLRIAETGASAQEVLAVMRRRWMPPVGPLELALLEVVVTGVTPLKWMPQVGPPELALLEVAAVMPRKWMPPVGPLELALLEVAVPPEPVAQRTAEAEIAALSMQR